MFFKFKLPLSNLLLLTICLAPLLLNFNPEEYPIPPQIKTLLDRAETKRCQFDFDSTVMLLQEAQKGYRKMGKEKEAVELYGRILYIFPETEMATEANNFALIDEAQAALDKLNTSNKAHVQSLLDIGQLRATIIHELALNKATVLSTQLERTLNPNTDWDLLAAVYTEMAGAYQYAYYEAEDAEQKINSYSQKAMQLIEKHLKTHHKEKAHLYYYYPYYLYYTYSNEASRFANAGDYEQALSTYQKTLTKVLDQQIFLDSLLYSTTYNSIAFLYQAKSDFDKSREYSERALLYTADRFPHAFAFYYKNIADGYQMQGKDDEAIRYLKKAFQANELRAAEEKDEKVELLFHLYRNMATSYVKLKKFEEALSTLNKLESLPKNLDPLPAWTLATRGFYYQKIGDYKKALAYHEQSLEAYGPKSRQRGSGYWNLGQIAMDQKDYKAALGYFQRSINIEIPNFDSDNVLDNPKYEDVIHQSGAINNLIDKLDAMRQLSIEKDALSTYGKCMMELSDLTLQLFEATRNSFERESSKRDLLQAAYAVYEQSIGLHLDLYAQDNDEQHLQTAFELSERSKSVLLMDALKESDALSFAGIPDSLVSQETELSNNVAFYQQQVFLAKQRKDSNKLTLYNKYLFESSEALDALKSRFEKEYPNYYQLKYKTTNISIPTLQKALPDKTVMLEYFEGRDEIFIFVLYQNALKAYRAPADKAYLSSVNKLYATLTNMSDIVKDEIESLANLKESSYLFYKNYVADFLPKGAKQLLIIPDGKFSYIPFEALLTEVASETMSFEALPYLLHQYNISYHYAAALWLEQLKQEQNAGTLKMLAMAASYEAVKANDKYSNERVRSVRDGLLPIPGTIDEVAGLKAKFGGKFLSGKTANESGFKENVENYGILHLAMHGIVDNKHPEYSGLVFTDDPSNTEDDLLHTYEIKSMQLNAELVVLSACETGFGKYQHGEGVASLGRGFMYAGAPSVVMTLWKLHDQSSVVLINSFYDNLATGMPKDEALRQAKLSYIETNNGPAAHPAFWAAFVQLGDNRPIILAKNVATNWGGSLIGWGLGIGGAVLALGIGLVALRRKNSA